VGSKRQQTFAKMERERKVKERQQLKREKKLQAAADPGEQAAEDALPAVPVEQTEDD
jgi:hypothetical protein